MWLGWAQVELGPPPRTPKAVSVCLETMDVKTLMILVNSFMPLRTPPPLNVSVFMHAWSEPEEPKS